MISLTLFPLALLPRPIQALAPVSRRGFFSKLKSPTHTLMAYVETSSTSSAAFTTLAGTCFSSAAEVEGDSDLHATLCSWKPWIYTVVAPC